MIENFEYVRVNSLKEAVEHLAIDNARVHAGGTDLLGCLRDRVFAASRLVSLGGLIDLRGITETAGGGLGIGAMTRLAELAEHPLVKERYPGLTAAALAVGSPQLRNQGTIGGNLCQKPRCWYYRGDFHCLRKGGDNCFADGGENRFHCIFGADLCCIVHPSDTAAALTALGAKLNIAGPSGRKTVSIDDFFVLPDTNVQKETILAENEILTDIVLPAPPANLKTSYRKVRARGSWDFALAGLASALVMDGNRVVDGRVVLSGVAPVPWRSKEVEDVIKNQALTPEVIARAATAAVEWAEPLDQNEYKIHLVKGIIKEELTALASS